MNARAVAIALIALASPLGSLLPQSAASLVQTEKRRPNGWVVVGSLTAIGAVALVGARDRFPLFVWQTDPAHRLSVLEAAALGAGVGAGMGLLLCANWGDCDWGPPRLPRLGPRKPRAKLHPGPRGVGLTIYR